MMLYEEYFQISDEELTKPSSRFITMLSLLPSDLKQVVSLRTFGITRSIIKLIDIKIEFENIIKDIGIMEN